jgi:hypothetical protein
LRTHSPEAQVAAQHDRNVGWDRLEAALTAAKSGDTVSIDVLSADSGLPRETILKVLTELTRAELFERRGEGVFVRRSMWEQTG